MFGGRVAAREEMAANEKSTAAITSARAARSLANFTLMLLFQDAFKRGERVKLGQASDRSRFGESFGAGRNLSLSPSEGERVGVRGRCRSGVQGINAGILRVKSSDGETEGLPSEVLLTNEGERGPLLLRRFSVQRANEEISPWPSSSFCRQSCELLGSSAALRERQFCLFSVSSRGRQRA